MLSLPEILLKYKIKKELLFLCLFSPFFLLNACSKGESKTTGNVQPDSAVTITITAVGDLMCHAPQFNASRVSPDSFDFSPVYAEVKRYLSAADFTFGNLETVTAGKERGYSGYPLFNSPDDYIPALKDAGFDLLTTANNHAFDQTEFGVRRTIEQLVKNDLNYNGTFISPADRDSIRLFNIKGIQTAFLAYTYGTNGNPVPKSKPYLINLIDFGLIEKDIKKARSLGADIVLVHYHFGLEYQREPNKEQEEIVKNTFALGADIVIGGHPHVIQPAGFVKLNNSKMDSGFAAYSMGNFISNQQKRYTDAGIILNISITKNFTRDSIYISDVNFIPTWVYKGYTGNGRRYIILPEGENSYGFLSPSDSAKMNQAFNDTRKILNNRTELQNIK